MKHPNYTEALAQRLEQEGIPVRTARRIAGGVLCEIQHRIYQDVMANLADIARDLSPHTERKSA